MAQSDTQLERESGNETHMTTEIAQSKLNEKRLAVCILVSFPPGTFPKFHVVPFMYHSTTKKGSAPGLMFPMRET